MTLLSFLRTHRRALNLTELARRAGIPIKALNKHFLWEESAGAKGLPLPNHHYKPLRNVLQAMAAEIIEIEV